MILGNDGLAHSPSKSQPSQAVGWLPLGRDGILIIVYF